MTWRQMWEKGIVSRSRLRKLRSYCCLDYSGATSLSWGLAGFCFFRPVDQLASASYIICGGFFHLLTHEVYKLVPKVYTTRLYD